MMRQEEGFALIITLLILTFMTLISMAVFQSSALEILIYGNTRKIINAQAGGEACSNIAERAIVQGDLLGKNSSIFSTQVPHCVYTDATMSDTSKPPVGYQYGPSGWVPWYFRTQISASHKVPTSIGAGLGSSQVKHRRVLSVVRWAPLGH